MVMTLVFFGLQLKLGWRFYYFIYFFVKLNPTFKNPGSPTVFVLMLLLLCGYVDIDTPVGC